MIWRPSLIAIVDVVWTLQTLWTLFFLQGTDMELVNVTASTGPSHWHRTDWARGLNVDARKRRALAERAIAAARSMGRKGHCVSNWRAVVDAPPMRIFELRRCPGSTPEFNLPSRGVPQCFEPYLCCNFRRLIE